MKQVRTVEDVYPAIEELIAELKKFDEQSRFAIILYHRMHQVAWTDRSELFQELQNVLTQALQSETAALGEPIKNQMQQILKIIDIYLKQWRGE